jgi:DNA-directed RNA polymerase subunit RPC12/RpoP
VSTTSEDIVIRCKACGEKLASGTLREIDERQAGRILSAIQWALNLVKCPACISK